jgi:SAM-dependent methyltransferase
MESNEVNASASFYGSIVGKVNELSIVKSCAALNLEMVGKYGRFDSAIFMGLGEGALLEALGPSFDEAVVLEGSDILVAQARHRFGPLPKIRLVNTYFETYEPPAGKKVSCLLGNHVLEHLDDPVAVLRRSRDWLAPSGVAVFTVPNATSLHRRVGVRLGILQNPGDLSDQDRRVGHRRVYDAIGLNADVLKAGYAIVESGGFNLKLVSQAQMIGWPDVLHESIYKVSRECAPDICSNLYVVCRPQ